MVGGDDYAKEPFNLATNGLRQPGSSFKPMTLVTGLEEGHSTDEVFNSTQIDIPFEVKSTKKNGSTETLPDLFEVNNYADTYRGPITLFTGTTFSDNSVYSQLGTAVGLEDIADTAEDLGIRSDLGAYDEKGRPLEFSLKDQDFAPLSALDDPRIAGRDAARDGPRLQLDRGGRRPRLRHDGRVEGRSRRDRRRVRRDRPTRAASPSRTRTATAASTSRTATRSSLPRPPRPPSPPLTSVVTSGTGERAQTGEPTWGKTGTTDDNGDAWFCGATPDITACVWVGHAESREPMLTEFGGAPVDGGTIPALIFADVVNAYLSVFEEEETEETAPVTETPVAPTTTVPAEPVVAGRGGGARGRGRARGGSAAEPRTARASRARPPALGRR